MQRLNAIFGLIENAFTYQNKYFDINEFSYAKQLSENDVFQIIREENSQNLSRQECADIVDYQLAVTIYTAMEEKDITEIFGRINANGKHLSRQERRQAGVTSAFSELVRTVSMKLRGDDSEKVLLLSSMPEISIDSQKSKQGYKIQAEETIWCKQGALSILQLRESEDEQIIADIAASILLNEPLPVSTERLDSLYDPLKTQVLAKFDTITYKGLSIIRIAIPPQKTVSFVDKTLFARKDSSTVSVEGPELLAIFQLFQK
jgi:uncharacterized protein with ParB-like and HNH nuclease domain